MVLPGLRHIRGDNRAGQSAGADLHGQGGGLALPAASRTGGAWADRYAAERGERVAILSENRYEWVVADLAIVGQGAVTVPIYATLTPDQCRAILADSGSRVVLEVRSHKVPFILEDGQIIGRLVADPFPLTAKDKTPGASFDPSDPSFSYTGEPGRVGNLIGPLGAWTADLLFMLFGLPAFIFPVAIAYGAWLAFKQGGGEAAARSTIALRAIGLVLALITSCGLATLHFAPGSLQSTAGGVLGSLVGESLASAASFLGATLLLLAFWFAGVQLFTGVSWLAVMDFLGHWTLRAVYWVHGRVSSARDQAAGRESREQREAVVREGKKKAAAGTPPRIEAPAPPVAIPTLTPPPGASRATDILSASATQWMRSLNRLSASVRRISSAKWLTWPVRS